MASQLIHFQMRRYRQREAKAVDRLMSVAAFVSPLMGVPQAVELFATKNASGLSLFSWVAFTVVAAIFLLYAIVHKIRPLIVAQSLWMAVYMAVIAGIILYG